MTSKSQTSQSAASVVKLLKKSKLTVSTAESITGGGLSSALTDIAGSSEVFLGGVVSYSDKSKIKYLGITTSLLKKETAVSEKVAVAMAEAIRVEMKSDYGISTTGVAGPGKAYGQKAGTVWIAIASKKGTISVALSLSGDREAVRNATIVSTLATFERILSS
jgi:PncC family amidohydrolase